MDAPTYRFHQYRLLPAQGLLLDGDKPVKLGSRAFEMLVALVERRDRVVHKHELMDIVWPRLVVEENNLQVHVLALRKLLGHGAIATVPGRGYRFTLGVQAEGDAPGGSEGASGAAPAPAAALIGRDAELRTLRELVARHTLVTVAGGAGIGKTSLARRAAATSAQPVCWVDLAGIDDATLLPAAIGQAISQAMGVALDGAADTQAAVLEALQGRAALLVLDNAEHLLDAVAGFVAAARQRSATVRLLVTSQEVLKLIDEQVFRPGPLSLPEGDDLASVQASSAVALFAARARLADLRFALGDDNRAAVSDICRRLDGIPLAIELAAARVALLGVDGVRQRLDERFNVLTAGARAAMRRHQTLRAALDWSYALLAPHEQRVLQRLAVFSGGFTLDAAQELAEDDTIDGWEALELLGHLVDKSLVVADGQQLPRYRLLETTRLYALERLAEAGLTHDTLLRHAACFAALATRCDAAMARHGQGQAELALLDAERDNLLHALAWCASAEGDVALGVRLVASLRYYWSSRGLLATGSALALRVLDRARALPLDAVLAQALGAAAHGLSLQGRRAEAGALARHLLDGAAQAGLGEYEARAKVMLGHLALDDGDLDGAQQWLDNGLAQARHEGHQRVLGAALNGLIAVASAQGRADAVAAHGDELLALQRAAGQAFNLCTSLLNLAMAALESNQPSRARACVAEAAPLVPGADSRFLDGVWLALVATVAAGAAPWADVLRVHAAAEHLRHEAQLDRHELLERHSAPVLAQALEALGEARYHAACAEGRALDRPRLLALAGELMASTAAAPPV